MKFISRDKITDNSLFICYDKWIFEVVFDTNLTKEEELLSSLCCNLHSQYSLTIILYILLADKLNILDKVNSLLLYSNYNYLVKL